ncbi:MAG: hypothetical protein HOP11_05930 [Saprospiraceae bacterium]|nr:hypothetical protein [Saprospiraceae bacterium]
MKDREFDNWIKGKVTELEQAYGDKTIIPPAEAEWNQISSKITTEIENHQFDSHIKSTLRNAKVLDVDANWELFQSKLQLVRERRNKIVGTRITEVLVLLLLFWTINYIAEPLMRNDGKSTSTYIAENNKNNNSTKDVKESVEPVKGLLSNNSISNQDLNHTNVNQSGGASVPKNKILSKGSRKAKPNNSRIVSPTDDKKADNYNKTTIVVIDPKPSEASFTTSNVIPNIDTANNTSEIVKSESKTNSADGISLESKDPPAVENKENVEKKIEKKENSEALPVKVLVSKKPVSRFFWLDLASGLNVVSVGVAKNIPDYVNRKSFLTNSINKKIGINLNFDKWIVETGLNIYSLDYEMSDYLNFENFGESVTIDEVSRLSFKLTELPLILHRKLFSIPKLDLTAFGGMSVTLCNDAEFTVRKESIQDTRRIYYDPNESIKYINIDFNNGISNDHTLSGNSFTNLIGGVRLSYKILDYFSLSAQASYSKMLETYGFGPIGHKFTTKSFGIGMQYNFN